MKKGMIISLILIMIVGIALVLSRVSYALEPMQSLNDLPSITSTGTSTNTTTNTTNTTTNTTSNTAANTTNTTNKTTNNTATNSSSSSKSKIPQTGSNSWIVYIAGVAVLAIVSGVVLKKFIGIKLQ